MTRHRVASLSDIPENGGLAVEVRGLSVGLFRTGETVRAVGESCPHMGASLCDGYLDGDNVVCPWHGWVFSLETGENLFDEDEESLPVFKVTVERGVVFIELNRASCSEDAGDPPASTEAA